MVIQDTMWHCCIAPDIFFGIKSGHIPGEIQNKDLDPMQSIGLKFLIPSPESYKF